MTKNSREVHSLPLREKKRANRAKINSPNNSENFARQNTGAKEQKSTLREIDRMTNERKTGVYLPSGQIENARLKLQDIGHVVFPGCVSFLDQNRAAGIQIASKRLKPSQIARPQHRPVNCSEKSGKKAYWPTY